MNETLESDSETSSVTDPGYAESVFSDISTGSTTATSVSETRPDFMISARDVLRDLILSDSELIPLFELSIRDPNLGLGRLTRNFRRLLGTYSQDLMSVAEENKLHIEVAKFVRMQRSYLCNSLRLRYEDQAGQRLWHGDGDSQTEQDIRDKKVNTYLETLASDQDHQPSRNELQDDGHGDEADEDTINSSLESAKAFLLSGPPLQNLRKSLRLFVVPDTEPEGALDDATSPPMMPEESLGPVPTYRCKLRQIM